MNLKFKNLAKFEIDIRYHGTGMPLNVSVQLNESQLTYQPITEDLHLDALIYFDDRTPFFIEICLNGKTYKHTDLNAGTDHYIEIVGLKFLDYDLMNLLDHSMYYAHRDAEKPDPGNFQIHRGSRIMGQNGAMIFGDCKQPFFRWYHEITHQGTLYDLNPNKLDSNAVDSYKI